MSSQHQPMHTTQYQETLPVHVLHTRSRDNEECYFVLRCSMLNFNLLLSKKDRASVNIADFGEILASGYGSRPSAYAITMLKTKHNVTLPHDV